MDFLEKALGKLLDLLASLYVIIGFGLWVVFHTATVRDYVSFISDTTFWVGLVILRNQIADARQQRQYVKRDLRESKKILRIVKKS